MSNYAYWSICKTACSTQHILTMAYLVECEMSVAKPEPNGRTNSPVRGRPFEKGNGGRRPGSRNRTTLVAEALLQGEEVELVRKAIELAKAGDVPMLKFLLDRILPKERSVRVELPPMERADDAVDALGAIINAVGTGQIASSEAAALATLVATYARTINVYELESRLDKIERDLTRLSMDP
jgi:hypothetical protein